MTDPIADMLTRIRNAGSSGHKWADIPVSKLKTEIANLLKDNYFIHDYKVLEDNNFGLLRVYLKYHEDGPIIRHLERVSRPGRRHYVSVDEIPRIRSGLGIAILSTSQGLMSGRTARQQGMGGELMAVIW